MPAYFDHAASTPLRPEALEAMLPFLTTEYANPSGSHGPARRARRALDDARDVIAEAVGARPGEVVFTSGGTEADNAAVLGVRAARPDAPMVVCSAIEHHAVLDPVQAAGGRLVPVRPDGRIDLAALATVLDDGVGLVSVMLVNNEVGTIQPLDEVAAVMAQRAPSAVLHTDAVQALPWLDVATAARPAALISLSAHKFGGPKGVGALVVRDGTPLRPLLLGGGQERDRRSGTPNVAGIVGLGAALAACVAERDRLAPVVAARRDRLIEGLLATVEGSHESGVGPNGDRSHKIAGNAHLCFDDIESEELLFLLDHDEVFATAASSCASGALDPSHVLAALGVPRDRAGGALRLSLSTTTADADVDRALAVIPAAVARLRKAAA